MKKFLLLISYDKYERGFGFEDFYQDYETLEEAIDAVAINYNEDNQYQIVNISGKKPAIVDFTPGETSTEYHKNDDHEYIELLRSVATVKNPIEEFNPLIDYCEEKGWTKSVNKYKELQARSGKNQMDRMKQEDKKMWFKLKYGRDMTKEEISIFIEPIV